MQTNRLMTLILAILLTAFLTACGGGGGDEGGEPTLPVILDPITGEPLFPPDPGPVTAISGVVLSEAADDLTVFIDSNSNWVFDDGDTLANVNPDGTFGFSSVSDERKLVLAQVSRGDKHFTLAAPIVTGQMVISPISTLMAMTAAASNLGVDQNLVGLPAGSDIDAVVSLVSEWINRDPKAVSANYNYVAILANPTAMAEKKQTATEMLYLSQILTEVYAAGQPGPMVNGDAAKELAAHLLRTLLTNITIDGFTSNTAQALAIDASSYASIYVYNELPWNAETTPAEILAFYADILTVWPGHADL